jgi:sugar phosphate isomerase/epimerase
MVHRKLTRRQILRAFAVGALTDGILQLLVSPVATAAPAAGDQDKTAMPRLFAGFSAFSYGKQLSTGKMTLEDFILKAVDLRLQGVDITTYYLKSTDPIYLNNLRRLANQNAVVISGVSCGVKMVEPDPTRRTGVLNEITRWVDVTERLGASRLRVLAGKVPDGTTMQQAVDSVVDTMKAATDYSGKTGITLAMENQPGLSQSPEVCLEVIHRVNSPYAGLNLDITHFVSSPAQDAYTQIGLCIPYAATTHIGNQFDDHTAIDLDRVWQLFAQAGFKGYMTAEYVGKSAEDEASNVPKLVAQVKALCERYSTV